MTEALLKKLNILHGKPIKISELIPKLQELSEEEQEMFLSMVKDEEMEMLIHAALYPEMFEGIPD